MSVYMSVSLYACLSVCLPACLPVFLSACLSPCLVSCLPPCLHTCLSPCLPVSPPVSLPAYLSISLPACLRACLPPCLSPCLPVSLTACLPARSNCFEKVGYCVAGWLSCLLSTVLCPVSIRVSSWTTGWLFAQSKTGRKRNIRQRVIKWFVSNLTFSVVIFFTSSQYPSLTRSEGPTDVLNTYCNMLLPRNIVFFLLLGTVQSVPQAETLCT